MPAIVCACVALCALSAIIARLENLIDRKIDANIRGACSSGNCSALAPLDVQHEWRIAKLFPTFHVLSRLSHKTRRHQRHYTEQQHNDMPIIFLSPTAIRLGCPVSYNWVSRKDCQEVYLLEASASIIIALINQHTGYLYLFILFFFLRIGL